jgi:hypothetical protein
MGLTAITKAKAPYIAQSRLIWDEGHVTVVSVLRVHVMD